MMTFHHVGVITSDIPGTTSFYRELGYEQLLSVDDPIQQAKIVLLSSPNGPMIELVSPTSEESPAFSWIKKIIAGPYHTCYECKDLDSQAKVFEGQGLVRVSEIATAITFDHRRIVFLWSKKTGLIELLEQKAL